MEKNEAVNVRPGIYTFSAKYLAAFYDLSEKIALYLLTTLLPVTSY